MKAVILQAVVFLALLVLAKGDNSYCINEAPLEDDPKRPVPTKSYTAHISGKRVSEKLMEMIEEYYDHDAKMLAIFNVYANQRVFQINNWKKGEIVRGVNGFCKTFDLNAYYENDDNHRSSLEYILDLHGEWKYKGETTARGISVKMWRLCTGDKNANFTADYYYSMDDHPFRLVIQGKQDDLYTDQVKDLLKIYDYFLYTEQVPESSHFKPPPGVSCNTSSLTTPVIGDSAFFTTEEIDPISKTVIIKTIEFSKEHQISSEIDSDGTKTMYDMKRGLQFTISPDGSCQKQPFFHKGRLVATSNSDDFLHPATLKHYLFDDGNDFTYNGQHVARGATCDVYTKMKKNMDGLGTSVIEIYSTQDSPVFRVVQKTGNYQHQAVTKQIEVIGFQSLKMIWPFTLGIDACYQDDDMIRFLLTLTGTVGNQEPTSNDITLQLTKILHIGSSRLQITRVASNDRGGFRVQGTFFQNEKPLQTFRHYPQMMYNQVGHFKMEFDKESTPSMCAQYCTKEIERPFEWDYFCRFFTFNKISKKCTFYADSFSKRSLKSNPIMDVYSKHYRSIIDGPILSNLWSKLQTMIFHGPISITTSAGLKFDVVSAEKVTIEDITSDQDMASDNPLSQFDYAFGDISNADPLQVLQDITIGACARQCLVNSKFDCRAFVYSTMQTSCHLYDDQKNMLSSNRVTEKSRKYYIRKYAANFHEIPGKTAMYATSDMVFSGVGSSESCAILCMKNTAFPCQSFELCGDTCLLGRNHFYDVPATDINLREDCTHFSRNFVNDYIRIAHKKTLSSANVVTVKNLDVQHCAQVCSSSTEYACNMFQFCATQSECHLTTNDIKSVADLKFQATGDCDLYERKTSAERFLPFTDQKTPEKSSSSGYTPGDMGGIAFGMVLLGIMLCVVLSLVFIKFRSKGAADSMAVGFSRSRLSETDS